MHDVKSRKLGIVLPALFMALLLSCNSDDEVTPIIPTIVITQDRQLVEPGDEISFTATTNDAASISWRFGDGNTSTEDNPVHTYTTVGEYTVTATVTSSTGDTSSTSTTVTVGNRLFAGFVISTISETDDQGNAWDTDGSGPELFFGFSPPGNTDGITLYSLGNDVTNTSIAATDLGGIGGLLPQSDRVLFTDGNWEFLLLDDDDPLNEFDQNEIMVVITRNPVTAEREELDFESGEGIILIEEGGYTLRLLYQLVAP